MDKKQVRQDEQEQRKSRMIVVDPNEETVIEQSESDIWKEEEGIQINIGCQ